MAKDALMIVEQADRCKTIVSGLLNFARKNKVSYRFTNIESLIDRAISSVIIPKTIRVKKTITEKITAEIDPEQVMQVLTNLIVNSFEAMPIGGLITISAKSIDRLVQISVEDTGSGIKEDILPKIFEPFFTTKQIGKGTGLGLAVVYGIVKMHLGRIFAESNSDATKGVTWSRFTVELPKHRNDLQQTIGNDNSETII
jgi:signal transduction histidine kinase